MQPTLGREELDRTAEVFECNWIGNAGNIGMRSFDAIKIRMCGNGAILSFNDSELRERVKKLLYFGLEIRSGYENSVAQKL